ncbi:MAG: hypothetical protein HOV81_16490 [Kofleriaceae bacterium]|nr:hypothetical protein [Kofleriaceae bacterium]
MMDEYFLVLRSAPDDATLIPAVNESVEAMVVILRSVFLYDHSARRDDTFTEHHWREQTDGGVTVTLVDDVAMPGRYLRIAGGAPQQRQRVWKNLAVMLPVVSVEELRRVAREPEEVPAVLQHLALAVNGSFDQETLDVVAGALASARLEVRMSAAAAALLLGWTALDPDLNAALAAEPTAEGRRALAHVIAVRASRRRM